MTKVNMTKKSKRSAIPRPLNSFMIFRLEHQASVSKETPGAKHQDISKKLSARWKALDPEEKQEYKAKALAAKEKHKLLYPDYKYSPRRRETASKKAKKSNSSKAGAVQTVASNVDYQPRIQQTDLSSAEQTGTTFAHPLQAVDVTIALSNDLDDDTSTAATCYDSLLLCPTLYEPSYHDPSASPSTFSMMSQFSGLSPSLSSDYEPTAALHYPEYYNSLGVHPYFCGSASDTYMPPSYECIPFFDYSSQMDQVAIPFDVYDAPIADLMPPQLVFPETQRQLPPAILDHTQPMLQADSQDTVHNLDFGSFNNTYALASETPLLTQSFVFIDYETMPY